MNDVVKEIFELQLGQGEESVTLELYDRTLRSIESVELTREGLAQRWARETDGMSRKNNVLRLAEARFFCYELALERAQSAAVRALAVGGRQAEAPQRLPVFADVVGGEEPPVVEPLPEEKAEKKTVKPAPEGEE